MVMEGEDADAAVGFGFLAMAAAAKVFRTFGSSQNQTRSEVHSCPKKCSNSAGECPQVSTPGSKVQIIEHLYLCSASVPGQARRFFSEESL